MWLAGLLSVLVAVILFMLMRSSNDPYLNEFHLVLNETPGLKPGQRPPTEWLNMGFWKDTASFPEACEALALRLMRAARIPQGGHVLDVGHGSGDSLLLLLSHPTIPRPSLLFGVTSLPAHHQRAKARLEAAHRDKQHTELFTIQTQLFQDDAVYHSESPTDAHTPDAPGIHPLSPHSRTQFDTILALDSAYHFQTRSLFLQQSFDKLEPGGRIALADIYFFPPPGSTKPSGSTIFLLSSIFRVMPRVNIVTRKEYVDELERIGYADVEVEDITEYVFPGFVRFLSGRGGGWKVFAWVMSWLQSRGARFGIIVGTKPLSGQ